MNTKLTLTIEEEVIKKAKELAKSQNRSLSEIIETYLSFLIKRNEGDKEISSSMVRELRGSFKDVYSENYKEDLSEALQKKYL